MYVTRKEVTNGGRIGFDKRSDSDEWGVEEPECLARELSPLPTVSRAEGRLSYRIMPASQPGRVGDDGCDEPDRSAIRQVGVVAGGPSVGRA